MTDRSSPDKFELLNEASNILCAANRSLKSLDEILEDYIFTKGEEAGYTYCDQSGDIYSIRKALQLLQEFIRAAGLKMDDVR